MESSPTMTNRWTRKFRSNVCEKTQKNVVLIFLNLYKAN